MEKGNAASAAVATFERASRRQTNARSRYRFDRVYYFRVVRFIYSIFLSFLASYASLRALRAHLAPICAPSLLLSSGRRSAREQGNQRNRLNEIAIRCTSGHIYLFNCCCCFVYFNANTFRRRRRTRSGFRDWCVCVPAPGTETGRAEINGKVEKSIKCFSQ